MVVNAPKIEEALPLFIDFVDGLPIAAHNVYRILLIPNKQVV
jgi:hypothetical protein